MEEKKVLLSIKDLEVKFRVRGRILTAIRNVSLDIYENESIAIVGESGSGKSVFTKTFAGMLDSNGFISNGRIIFNDEELIHQVEPITEDAQKLMEDSIHRLNANANLQFGASTYREMLELESEYREKTMPDEKGKPTQTPDAAWLAAYNEKKAALQARYNQEIAAPITEEMKEQNLLIAKEIHLSVGRLPKRTRKKRAHAIIEAFKKAMQLGLDLSDEDVRTKVFEEVTFRVAYVDETETELHGTCILNLAKVQDERDWGQIRGKKISTVFQDPMTSLDPIITIGKQMTSIIMKHQKCSEVEARRRAIEMMDKVGIPHPEARFDDYPFQYSGGMRQRIVIAIALSCQPKILICDEPTTALDVTIQAQILQLIKDLQKEFNYTTVFITHDLGVVANIADRVAVIYAGQIVELGTVGEVFYDPRHPYTWALLSSLPQLAQRNTKLYSITGTPPSLYNEIKGDAFAPRNPYCLKIDTLLEPPMFQVTDTHYAKTWLLEENAPKLEKPEGIHDIHEKLTHAFNIQEI
ncbi:MAG: ABC transporter ATP-binding protein [Clostridiales bacterium]|nr:ABC transporter ATP-binding protein [Clostridiales bacterium]